MTPSKRGRWFPLIFVQVHETCFFAFSISQFRQCKECLHAKRVPVPGTGTRLPCKDSLRSLNLEIVQVHFECSGTKRTLYAHGKLHLCYICTTI
jgi:hypothetical protein